MAEPISSSTGAVIGAKLYGLIVILSIAAFFSWLIVVMTRIPRSRPEWVVSLISTVVGSICGGAYITQKYLLFTYADTFFGTLVLGGLFFICGLPVWAIIRWVFNYVNAREDATIFEVIDEVKQSIKKDSD